MLRCREVSKLVSESMEHQLPLSQTIAGLDAPGHVPAVCRVCPTVAVSSSRGPREPRPARWRPGGNGRYPLSQRLASGSRRRCATAAPEVASPSQSLRHVDAPTSPRGNVTSCPTTGSVATVGSAVCSRQIASNRSVRIPAPGTSVFQRPPPQCGEAKSNVVKSFEESKAMRCVFKPTIAALAVTGLLFVGSVPVLARSGSRSVSPTGSGVRTPEPGSKALGLRYTVYG